LPEERIAFMGDLLFIDCHPYLMDGDPWEWAQVLERIEALPIETAVPGHGPIGGAKDLPLVRRYIIELEKLAAEVIDSGGTLEDSAHSQVPRPFDTWRMSSFFSPNMRFLHKRLEGGL
jgi:glyoxylase-like metal-dependent hydrolase (beta-lactamase superfamily II)